MAVIRSSAKHWRRKWGLGQCRALLSSMRTSIAICGCTLPKMRKLCSQPWNGWQIYGRKCLCIVCEGGRESQARYHGELVAYGMLVQMVLNGESKEDIRIHFVEEKV